MSYVMMKVPVHLCEGCPLDYLGKRVAFLRYAEVLVGPLDPMGRRPGRYTDRDNMIVRYSDGDLRVPVKDVRFVDTYPKPPAAHIQNGVGEVERLGDLPYPIELWPEDRIKDHGRNKEWSTVAAISFDDGKPVYELWNDAGSVKLTLHYKPSGWLDRGNVYHLYNDPENLKFGSDEEELVFWTRIWISVCKFGNGDGLTMRSCVDLFDKGHIDLITRGPEYDPFFHAYRLHDIFAGHRSRVRELTQRVFGREIQEVRDLARQRSEVQV